MASADLTRKRIGTDTAGILSGRHSRLMGVPKICGRICRSDRRWVGEALRAAGLARAWKMNGKPLRNDKNVRIGALRPVRQTFAANNGRVGAARSTMPRVPPK